MKIGKLLFILLFGVGIEFCFAQTEIKRGFAIQVGADMSIISPRPTGSLKNRLGFRGSLSRGFNLFAAESQALQVTVEAGYNSFYVYRPTVIYDANDQSSRLLYHSVEDQQFKSTSLDIGIGFRNSREVGNAFVFYFEGGANFGVATEWLTINLLSSEIIGPQNPAYPTYYYGPHGEYNMDAGGWIDGYNLGFGFAWSHLLLDLKYRRISYLQFHSIMPVPKKLFLSVGYAF